jgi:hypothetical protein
VASGCFVKHCHASPALVPLVQTPADMFRWGKQRPPDALRRRRGGEAAQRVANVFPDRHLPDRPSLDGYTVGELSAEQAARLFNVERSKK